MPSDLLDNLAGSRERASLAYTRGDFRDAALALMPPGWAWSRDPDSVQYKLWTGLVGTHYRAYRRILDMLEESDPRTAYETLDMWETDCGLPDPCLDDPPTSIEARRAAVVARRHEGATTTPTQFVAVAATLGYDIEITEYRPFRAWSSCDAFLNTSPAWTHVWRVHVFNPSGALYLMRCRSACNAFLREYTQGELECLFERIKPAQTHIIWTYSLPP